MRFRPKSWTPDSFVWRENSGSFYSTGVWATDANQKWTFCNLNQSWALSLPESSEIRVSKGKDAKQSLEIL